MKRKPLREAVQDWEDNWNAHKDQLWREKWADEIELERPKTFDEWALTPDIEVRTSIGPSEQSSNVKLLTKQLYEAIEGKFPHLLGSGLIFGICNMSDDLFFIPSEPLAYEWAVNALKDLKKGYSGYLYKVPSAEQLKLAEDPNPNVWSYETRQKYGYLIMDGQKKWAIIDLGKDDLARRGGLIYIGGRGRPEPRKYLRSHLYPDTIIKSGWMPKKQLKTLLGKPYPYPLYGAIKEDGSLNYYAPSYYI